METSDSVTVWVLEDAARWEVLRTRGVLDPDPELAGCFPFQYEWRRRHLAQHWPGLFRAEDAPWSGPLIKPDLRYWRHNLSPGRYVRIQLALPRAEVVSFDHCLWWEGVLNGYYLARTEAEEREQRQWETEQALSGNDGIEHMNELTPSLRDRLLTSWQRIFDVRDTPPYCLWMLFPHMRLENVIEVREFTVDREPEPLREVRG